MNLRALLTVRNILLVALIAFAVALVGVPALAAGSAWDPPPDTIVAVEGDRKNGFTIHFHDGSSISPPTDSEAFAECQEYDTRINRVRCWTEVRTWYRDLLTLKRALRLAQMGP